MQTLTALIQIFYSLRGKLGKSPLDLGRLARPRTFSGTESTFLGIETTFSV